MGSITKLRYNYTSDHVPGAYYGVLPELEVLKVAVPGTANLVFNFTDADKASNSSWDYLWTSHYNRPDPLSVYPSETGYQYSFTAYFGDGLPPSLTGQNELTTLTFQLNDTLTQWEPGDCIIWQYVELESDGRTPTGRRAFSQNITLVANQTDPQTTTAVISYPFSTRSYTSTSYSSRLPPNPTYYAGLNATTTGGSGPTPTQTGSASSVKRWGWKSSGIALLLVSLGMNAL